MDFVTDNILYFKSNFNVTNRNQIFRILLSIIVFSNISSHKQEHSELYFSYEVMSIFNLESLANSDKLAFCDIKSGVCTCHVQYIVFVYISRTPILVK